MYTGHCSSSDFDVLVYSSKRALYSLYSSICVQMAHTQSAARRRGFGVEGRFKVFVYAFSVVLVASMVTLSILRQVRGSLLCLNFSVVTHIHTAVQIGTNGNDNACILTLRPNTAIPQLANHTVAPPLQQQWTIAAAVMILAELIIMCLYICGSRRLTLALKGAGLLQCLSFILGI